MTAAEQLAAARATYTFLPERVRIVDLPASSSAVGEFSGLDPDGTALVQRRPVDALLEPFDKTLMHELAHAGHAWIRARLGLPWFQQISIADAAASRAADPMLQAFWLAMEYSVSLEAIVAAGRPMTHDADPVELFAEAFGYIAAGLRADPVRNMWVQYGGDLEGHRATLEAFFRGLADRVFVPPPQPIPAPTPAPGPDLTSTVAPTDDLAAHYFSQWDGDHVGQGDCVPTSAKMLLSLYGVSPLPTIAQLRERCDIDADGVVNLGRDAGITLGAARAALHDYGMAASAVSAADVPFDDVLEHVREGKPTIVFVSYGYISNRVDRFAGLHAMLIAGVRDDGAVADVLDPDRDYAGQHPDQRGPVAYALDELRAGWDAGRASGGGALIPDEARGEDMDGTEFRRRFLEVYSEIGVAKKFDAIATQIGDTIHMVERVQDGEKIQDDELAAAKARLDKLRTI